MSCEKNGNIVNRTAALRTGISALGGKVGRVSGQVLGTVTRATDTASEQVGRRVAPVSNRVLQTVDRPTTIAANLLPAVATAAAYSQVKMRVTEPGQGRRPAVALAVGMREAADIAARTKTLGRIKQGLGLAILAGNVAAPLLTEATKKPGGRRSLTQQKKSLLSGPQKLKVEFAPSRLTGLLNRHDRLVSGRHVLSSQGELVHMSHKGTGVWHRGTTVIQTGESRQTITHLRKLALPPASHYFERALSDGEVASLVSGQSQPYKMSGHVGTIGAMESLAPTWAAAKRAMILTRLHWPTPDKSAAADWVRTPVAGKQRQPVNIPSTAVKHPQPVEVTP